MEFLRWGFEILVLWEVGFGSMKRDTLLNERAW